MPKLAVSFKELHKSLKSELRNRCPPWRKTLQLQGGNSCFLNSFLGGAGSCRKSSDSYFATSIALAGGIRATGSTAFINFFDPCAFFCLCHTVVVVAAHVVVTEVAIVGAVVTVVVVGGGGGGGSSSSSSGSSSSSRSSCSCSCSSSSSSSSSSSRK